MVEASSEITSVNNNCDVTNTDKPEEVLIYFLTNKTNIT